MRARILYRQRGDDRLPEWCGLRRALRRSGVTVMSAGRYRAAGGVKAEKRGRHHAAPTDLQQNDVHNSPETISSNQKIRAEKSRLTTPMVEG